MLTAIHERGCFEKQLGRRLARVHVLMLLSVFWRVKLLVSRKSEHLGILEALAPNNSNRCPRQLSWGADQASKRRGLDLSTASPLVHDRIADDRLLTESVLQRVVFGERSIWRS